MGYRTNSKKQTKNRAIHFGRDLGGSLSSLCPELRSDDIKNFQRFLVDSFPNVKREISTDPSVLTATQLRSDPHAAALHHCGEESNSDILC